MAEVISSPGSYDDFRTANPSGGIEAYTDRLSRLSREIAGVLGMTEQGLHEAGPDVAGKKLGSAGVEIVVDPAE